MIIFNQNIKTIQKYIIWILTAFIHTKTEDFHKDIADDAEKRYDTSNYEVHRPLPQEMNKKVIGLTKDELGGKIITEFVAPRPKTYYLTNDDKNVKKDEETKKTCNKKNA